MLGKESGSHFDPKIVALFEEVQTEGDDEEDEVNEAEVFSRERQAELMLGLAGTYLSAGDLETAGKGYEEILGLFPEGGKARPGSAMSGQYQHLLQADVALSNSFSAQRGSSSLASLRSHQNRNATVPPN